MHFLLWPANGLFPLSEWKATKAANSNCHCPFFYSFASLLLRASSLFFLCGHILSNSSLHCFSLAGFLCSFFSSFSFSFTVIASFSWTVFELFVLSLIECVSMRHFGFYFHIFGMQADISLSALEKCERLTTDGQSSVVEWFDRQRALSTLASTLGTLLITAECHYRNQLYRLQLP